MEGKLGFHSVSLCDSDCLAYSTPSSAPSNILSKAHCVNCS